MTTKSLAQERGMKNKKVEINLCYKNQNYIKSNI